mmetsp:Transcript_47644/g.142340  ORF Transcript_47644/g.142340 Transcript_47644/m.142340 type:complete len:348 (-) Transcript_47644:203-1246(-)
MRLGQQRHRLRPRHLRGLAQGLDTAPLDLEPRGYRDDVPLITAPGNLEMHDVRLSTTLWQLDSAPLPRPRALCQPHFPPVHDLCVGLLPAIRSRRHCWRPLSRSSSCGAPAVCRSRPCSNRSRGSGLRGGPLCRPLSVDCLLLPLDRVVPWLRSSLPFRPGGLLALSCEGCLPPFNKVRHHLLDRGVRGVPAEQRHLAGQLRRGELHVRLDIQVLADQLPLPLQLLLQRKSQRQLLPIPVRQRNAYGAGALRCSHRHQWHEVGVLEAEHQGLPAALGGQPLEGQVDAPEENRRQRHAKGIPLRGTRQDHDGPPQRMRQHQHMHGVEEGTLPADKLHHLGPFSRQLGV